MAKSLWLKGAVMAVSFGVLAVAPGALAAPSDPWITTKGKIALMTADDVSGTAINVDTIDGRVTLHGKVRSDAEKTKAEQVVRKIEGVKEVRNLLQVVPAKQEDAVQASDGEIKDRVQEALKADKRLEGSNISVQSVNKGVVLLAGDAKTMNAHLHALTTAASVRGVRRVASEVKSPNTMADAEIRRTTGDGYAAASKTESDKKAARADDKRDEGYGIGDAGSDMWITSATKLRLMADSETPALDINVDTRDGVVTLFGIVPSEQAKRAAEANARKVSGVKSVLNELQVVASSAQDVVKANDADVQQAVENALERREDLKDANIDVEVKDGVARLSGTVKSEDDRLRAAIAARSTRGVRSVLWDDLRM